MGYTMANAPTRRLLLTATALLFSAVCLLPSAQAMKGPDADSYYWMAQGDPGGPTYNFQDITTTGKQASFVTCPSGGYTLGPDITDPVPLNFHSESPFNLYDRLYSQVRINIGGELAFEPPALLSYNYADCDAYYALCGIAVASTGGICPSGSASTPNYQVAAMWTALGYNASDPRSGVYYETVCHNGDTNLNDCSGTCRDADPNVPFDPNSNNCRIFITQWNDLKGCFENYGIGTSCGIADYSSTSASGCTPPTYTFGYYNGGPNTFESKLFEGSNRVEVHFKATQLADEYENYCGTNYNWGGYQGIVMGVEGSGGKGGGRLYHGIAFKDVGNIAMSWGSNTWKPKTSWAIEYVRDHPPVADFENFSVPPNLYHDGRLGDDPCDKGVPATGCISPWPNPEPAYFHGTDLILFQDRSTDADGKGDIVNYTWNFGDGKGFSYVANPTYNYQESGVVVRTAILTVKDSMGIVSTKDHDVNLYPNRAPTVSFSIPSVADAMSAVPFTDTSLDTDGRVVQWSWDFGDNQVLVTQTPGVVQHVYDSTGQYTVKLKACDDDGACGTVSRNIQIDPAPAGGQNILENPPAANAGADTRVLPGAVVQLSGYETNGHADAYLWKQVSGPHVDLQGADTRSPSFAAPQLLMGSDGRLVPARLAFALVVTDNGRESAPATVVVTVAGPNVAPVADAGSDQGVAPGDEVVLDGAKSADVDGDALTVSWMQVAGPQVTLSDASSLHPSFVAPSVVDATSLVFALKVDDGQGAVDSKSVTVTVAPRETGFSATPQGASVVFHAARAGQSYAWSFGDGQTSTDAAPVHAYL
ncbi:MAG: PKD domain-containing protein, partial [Thermoplasmatota archaeon]